MVIAQEADNSIGVKFLSAKNEAIVPTIKST